MIFKLPTLSSKEKYTFNCHLAYSLIEGFLVGVFILNEFVFIKSLYGSNYQLSVLFQFSVVVLLISIFTNELMESIKNKKKLLRILAIITRLPLVFMFFFPGDAADIHTHSFYNYYFLFAFFMYYLASPIILPSINLLLKNNYEHEHFGKLYSIVTSSNKIVMLVVTFLFGLLLDYDNYAFRYIYPLAGIFGIVSVFLLTKIDDSAICVRKSFSVWGKIKTTLNQTLVNNKAFRDFQISLMFYGFGFMSTVTVITIFYDVVLNLNYTSVAFYKNVYNILAIIMLPFFGKLISRIDQRRFSVISIASLLLYIIFVMLTEFFAWNFEFYELKIYYMLLFAVVFHAFFAATMSLSWSIGSAYFCKREEAGAYQSVHLSLTGLRGVVFPLIGIVVYEQFGFAATYVIASVALIFGILILLYSEKTTPAQKN